MDFNLHLAATHRSQDLSNTIWALAVLRYQPDGTWWDHFERQVRPGSGSVELVLLGYWDSRMLRTCSPYLLNCPATTSHPNPARQAPLAALPPLRQVYKNVTDFTARELANLLWALAILDHRPSWILDCVLAHALDNLSSYSPNSLHLLVWSLAKLGHQPSEVRPAREAGGCDKRRACVSMGYHGQQVSSARCSLGGALS